MKLTLIALTFTLAFALSNQTYAAPEWRKYESQNFIVYSDLPKKRALKKIHNFEQFKLSLHKLLNISESAEVVPFEVYLFKNKGTLRKFTKRYSTSGFYMDRLGHPLMVVGPESRDSTFFHEYVHFLNHRLGNFVYPRWYSEGMAEFYSTLEIKNNRATIGAVPQDRVEWLRYEDMLPMKSLLEPGDSLESARFSARFYATSWLLAHRMFLGSANGMKDYSDPFKKYLLRYTQGEKSPEVFFEEFGVDGTEMSNDLRRYARMKKWNAIGIEVPEISPKIKDRPLNDQEVVNIKVRLALASNNWDYAQSLLTDNQKIIDSEGRAAMAIIRGHASKEIGEEASLIEDLIEEHSLSGAAHAYLGHALFDFSEKEPENRDALLKEALNQLETARTMNALYGENALLVEVYWELGRKQSALNEIIRLLKLNPASLSVNLLAGEYSIKAGMTQDARFFLNRVVDWAHSEGQAEKAIQLLAELDSTDAKAK